MDPWQPPSFHVSPHDLPCPIAEQPGRYEGPSDAFGVRPTLGLNTALILSCDMLQACTDGVTLMELFGGMSAGLEMFLACGIRVLRYLYCDTDAVAQAVANYRCN